MTLMLFPCKDSGERIRKGGDAVIGRLQSPFWAHRDELCPIVRLAEVVQPLSSGQGEKTILIHNRAALSLRLSRKEIIRKHH